MQIKNDMLVLSDGAAAKYVSTRKKGGKIAPVGIVMHYTAGYSTAGDVDQLSRAQAAVSAHVVVGRDGEIVQIVPFNEAAWHAGPSKYKGMSGLNKHFIGIEISNCGWLRRLPDGNYKDGYGQIINANGTFTTGSRKLYTAPKNWLHAPHSRLGSGEFAWETYYEPQLKAVEELVQALCAAYNIQWIVSHEEIDTREWKTDPGPAFPMERFKALIGKRAVKAEIGNTPTKPVVKAPPVYMFPDKPAAPKKPAVFDDTALAAEKPFWRRAWDYFRK